MLNPYQLTPTASINRVKIMSAPGLPPQWRGKTANELLGREALIRLLSESFPDLMADPFPEFERRYLAQNHPLAESIAAEIGLRVACLLLTLKLGEAENRAVRAEWDESYWTHWASIDQVILGGGLVAGLLGQRVVVEARRHLDNLLTLDVARYADKLPLLGAALKHGILSSPALAFDFGNTAIKRAIYQDMTLIPLPTASAKLPTEPTELLRAMVDVIVESWQSAQQNNLTPQISASIANYVQDCQVATNTSYGQLRLLSDNSCKLIAAEVSRALGKNIKVMLIHDGTAAAYVYAGSPRTAVILLGTALGVGFPPPSKTIQADVTVLG